MLADTLAIPAPEPFKEASGALTPTQMAFSLSSSASSYTSEDGSDDGSNGSHMGSPFGTAWTSLNSSVTFPQRECHDDLDSPYCLPADGVEKARLDKQHIFIRDHICDGRLVLDDSLALKEGALILDLGTGSGAWASDMAHRVPVDVEIQGIDISNRLFPPELPNVTFNTGNVLDLPAHLQSRVTLAHQRLLIYALRRHEWSQAITSIKNTLIPGEGVVQLTEVFTPIANPGAAQEQFHHLLSS